MQQDIPLEPQDDQRPPADPPLSALPSERYEISLIQHGKYATTTITLPHETERDAAVDRAHEALLLHPPGTEVAIYRHTLVLHSQIDERRQIHRAVLSDAIQ